ncbi:hypothetical protein [Streptomyces bungoensis]|uniref:hypothetical protein n=1 Tax=Streptomyces bungoensis TaxID=285568 RepID=UPI00342A3620
MNALTVTQLAAYTAERHGTFLGEDFIGWRVAAILAIIACIAWELFMALTRLVSLRIPFLVLYLARLTTPKELWQLHYKAWKAELWFRLNDRDKHWVIRFFRGMTFSVPLALGGARLTARADKEAAPRRNLIRQLADRGLVIDIAASIATSGAALRNVTPSVGAVMLAVMAFSVATRRIRKRPGRGDDEGHERKE